MIPILCLTLAALAGLITLAAGLLLRTRHDPDHGTRPQDIRPDDTTPNA